MSVRSIIMACALITTALYAEWCPDCISTEYELPQDPSFTQLKKAIFNELKSSWVTEEKAELIMDLVTMTRPKVCVEIGAFMGSSALPIAASLKYLKDGKLYLIDAWSNEEAVKGISSQDPNYEWWNTLDMRKIKQECMKMVSKWNLSPYCQIFHTSSEKAAQRIKEIDFLHLDGSFSKEGSLLDVKLYLPKVKPGGYILLSNVYMVVDQVVTKMDCLWDLCDECDPIAELEGGECDSFAKKIISARFERNRMKIKKPTYSP